MLADGWGLAEEKLDYSFTHFVLSEASFFFLMFLFMWKPVSI